MCSRRAPAVPQACTMISSEALYSQDPFPVRTTLDAVTLASLSLSPLDWMAARDQGPGCRSFDTNPPRLRTMAPYLACTLEQPACLWSRWWIGTAGSRFPTELRATQLLRTVTWIFLQFWWISEGGKGKEKKRKRKMLLSWIWWVIFSVRKEKRTGGAGCVCAESAPAPYLKAVAFNSGIILAGCVGVGCQIWTTVKKKRKIIKLPIPGLKVK